MTLNARESLSALVDNEGDELELRRVLKSLADDDGAVGSWRRYHLIGAAMRREVDSDPSVDLSAGIMARLEQESVSDTAEKLSHDHKHTRQRGWARRGGSRSGGSRRADIGLARGAGIAAAVSLMVISGVQFYNGSLGNGSLGDSSTVVPGLASNGGSGIATDQHGGGLARVSARQPSLMDLPMFQSGGGNGLMTVGAQVASPMILAPSSARSSGQADYQQAQLLQAYLDRHAQGAAFSSADNWAPVFSDIQASVALGARNTPTSTASQ